MLKNSSSNINNQKGMAVIELIPTLFIYMLLINFGLGFFGAIHTGILNNIASRNYMFETLRHRANVGYHRNNAKKGFHQKGYRFSGIVSDKVAGEEIWYATGRPLAFTSNFGGSDAKSGIDLSGRDPASESADAKTIHNRDVNNLNEAIRNTAVDVSKIWIKSVYGICLNAACGD